MLCDGRLRDFDELAAYTSAFYCKGETTRAGVDIVQPFVWNVPVVVDGVTVVPGDYVYADKSGAVIVPAAVATQVMTAARKIVQDDRRFLEEIRDEKPDDIRAGGSREK